MKRLMRVLALALAMVLLLTSAGVAETLRFPDRNAAVVRLQQALKQAGYYDGTVDGQFGTGTRAAVKEFQKAQGLTADGVAGEKTQARLEALTGIQISLPESVPTDPPQDPGTDTGLFAGDYRTMSFGTAGDRVRILQRALMALGFEISKIDGDFGTSTYKAVKAFQQAVGLTADGKAGRKTLIKIESYFDEKGNVTTGPLVTDKPSTDEDIKFDVPTRTLRKGMSGLDVEFTQNRLIVLKYYTGKADGQFGTAMYQAVKAFQARNGLTADGVIGSGTRKVLFGAGAVAADDPVATPETHRTLRLGMEGTDVANLQKRLTELGYYSMTVDGQYGKGTVAAVKAFQGRNNLPVDGVCGSKTSAAIYANDAIDAGSTVTTPPPASTTEKPTRTLEKGDEGNDVISVQNRLKALGYYTIKVDGQYGSGTVTAVKLFQARNKLTVDGKVGAKTADVLYSDDAIAADGTTNTETPTDPPSNIPTRTLRLGDTGSDVVLLQARLIELGYLDGQVDGTFGNTTLVALKEFQLRNGLTADGVAGDKTYKKMFSSSAVKPDDEPDNGMPTRTLYKGCEGEDVRLVQVRLKGLGYLTSSADGKYGDKTVAAMKAFQTNNGLAATGVGDPNTYKVLFSLDAVGADGVTTVPPTSAPTYTTLRKGDKGNDVLALQQALKELKYTVNLTGEYDDVTYSAVVAFQRRNSLSVDGVAGKNTQTKLYSGNCVTGDTELPGGGGGSGTTGNGGGPSSVSQVQLLHWYDDVKGKLMKYGSELLVYEPTTNSSYYVRVYSQGHHCDAEPVTKEDVNTMLAIWDNNPKWRAKAVYVRMPNGTWCLGATHPVAHDKNFIAGNGFDGHICVHFPRTMSECIENDPDWGVTNQNVIRDHWKKLTGETIPW